MSPLSETPKLSYLFLYLLEGPIHGIFYDPTRRLIMSKVNPRNSLCYPSIYNAQTNLYFISGRLQKKILQRCKTESHPKKLQGCKTESHPNGRGIVYLTL